MSKLALTYRKCANDSICMLHLVGLSLFILKHILALGLTFSGCSHFGLLLPIRSNNNKKGLICDVLYTFAKLPALLMTHLLQTAAHKMAAFTDVFL